MPATVRLGIVPDQARPAGYAINGLRAERRIRMEDYAMTLEDAGRSVPMPDPLESLVGRFVAACRAPRAARDAEHESSRIAARVAILDHVVAQFRRP